LNQIRENFLQLASRDDSGSCGGFVITKESEIMGLLEQDLQEKILLLPTEYRPPLRECYRSWITDNWDENIDQISTPNSDPDYDKFIYKTFKLL
jgi:hypothetical protein